VRILFAAVELSPLAKVGGLADVAGALPKDLLHLGHDIRVVVPLHGVIDRARHELRDTGTRIALRGTAGRSTQVGVWRYDMGGVPVDLLDLPELFGRPQVYGEADDDLRWVGFCDAALGYLGSLAGGGWTPDVLHLNEWHSAFIAARLRERPELPQARLPRLFTIHNLAIHGGFSEEFAKTAGLTSASLSSQLAWEPWVSHSGMGQGLLWSDLINTVSPTYAKEILTSEYGSGLDPLLRTRRDSLYGVLNGIDYEEFDPARDQRLPARYDAEHFDGHAVNKAELQGRFGLERDPLAPLMGMVTRLFFQKGADLAVDAVEIALKRHRLQFAVLGTGDKLYHEQLTALAEKHPGRVGVRLAFDADLAQLVYGGSDMFLMPSRFEPCGLGQMIAKRYGSVPVVRRTGGLADTVFDWDAEPERGNGFVFDEATAEALEDALERAIRTFGDADAWSTLVRRGMAEDHSWSSAAREYAALYERTRSASAAPGNPARAPARVAADR
jgi:starch synthase